MPPLIPKLPAPARQGLAGSISPTVRLCRATQSVKIVVGTHRAIGRARTGGAMIRKLKSGQYRLYSMKKNPKTGRRRNLGTFSTRQAAQKHERAVQYFKRH